MKEKTWIQSLKKRKKSNINNEKAMRHITSAWSRRRENRGFKLNPYKLEIIMGRCSGRALSIERKPMDRHPIEIQIEKADKAIIAEDFDTLLDIYTDDAVLVVEPGRKG